MLGITRIFFKIILCGFGFFAFSCNPEKAKEEVQTQQQQPVVSIPLLDSLNRKIESNPNDPELYFARGNVYLKTGDVVSALADLNKAMNMDSTQSKYYIAVSDIYLKQNDITRAINVLQKGLEIQPEDVSLLLLLSKYYFYANEHAQSIRTVDQVLKLEVHNPQAYFLKGMIFKEKGDTSKSISNFQTAVEQDPKMYDAYMQLGLLFSARKDKTALDYFTNALRVNETSLEAKYGIAMFYQNNKNYEQALEKYKEIISEFPQHKTAYYNVGYIYFQLDSIDKADKNFDLAINISPAYADAFYMRGLCAESKGDKKNAAYYYRQTLNLSPQHELAAAGLKRIENS